MTYSSSHGSSIYKITHKSQTTAEIGYFHSSDKANQMQMETDNYDAKLSNSFIITSVNSRAAILSACVAMQPQPKTTNSIPKN